MKPADWKAFNPYAGLLSLILTVSPLVGPAPGALARSHKAKSQPVIRVQIYNYAHVGRASLHDAERQATSLVAEAGVRIAWLDDVQEKSPIRSQREKVKADLFLRILPPSMSRRGNYDSGAMGVSIIPSGTKGPLPGRIANVFYDRVEHFSALWGLYTGDILGDAIAHELGHLLIGPQHSRIGIMKAPWTLRDVAQANRCGFRFSPEQAAAIRRAARSLQHGGIAG